MSNKPIEVIEIGLATVIILLVGSVIGYTAGRDHAEVVTQVEERVEYVKVPEYKTIEVVKEVEPMPETELTPDEIGLIAGVVWAEAGNQDMIGKRLVVDAILNRVGKPGFAKSVTGVVYQYGQFVPCEYYTEECVKAVEMEMYERLDYRVMWFSSAGYLPYGVPAYQHGAHYFSWLDDVVPLHAGEVEER